MYSKTTIQLKVIYILFFTSVCSQLWSFEKRTHSFFVGLGANQSGVSLTKSGESASLRSLELNALETPTTSIVIGKRFDRWAFEVGALIRDSQVNIQYSDPYSFKEKFSKSNFYSTVYYHYPVGSYYEVLAGVGLSAFKTTRKTTGNPEQFSYPQAPMYSHILPNTSSIQPKFTGGLQFFILPNVSMRSTFSHQFKVNKYFEKLSLFNIEMIYYI